MNLKRQNNILIDSDFNSESKFKLEKFFRPYSLLMNYEHFEKTMCTNYCYYLLLDETN